VWNFQSGMKIRFSRPKLSMASVKVILVRDLKSSFNLAKIKVAVINFTHFYFEKFFDKII
jgi:hypothetical protein